MDCHSLLLSFAGIAAALSSVVLYGIVDAGITYRNNERTGSPRARRAPPTRATRDGGRPESAECRVQSNHYCGGNA
jgi:predicted porin